MTDTTTETLMYERTITGNSTRHQWTIVAEGCAAHLWVQRYGDSEPFGGIEIHSPKPSHNGQTPTDCRLLKGGKCYHDGTSLGAEPYVTRYKHGHLTDDEAYSAVRPYLRRIIDESKEPTHD